MEMCVMKIPAKELSGGEAIIFASVILGVFASVILGAVGFALTWS
jgi:hypothetical protein